MQNKKISVIIPTYNGRNKIGNAVKSIEESNYPKNKIEILIVDDCSTDDTARIISLLKKEYKNIIYLKTDKNMGPAGARNVGIKKSSGEYVFFTDDDCTVPKNWIGEFIEFYQKNKEVVGVGGTIIPSKRNIFSFIENQVGKYIIKNKINTPVIGKMECPAGFTGNMSYKKSAVIEAGLFNPKKRTGEELDLKKRICQKNKIAYVPINVIHNQDYDLKYFLKQVYEKGLEKTPPKNFSKLLILTIIKSPIIFINIFRKSLGYINKK